MHFQQVKVFLLAALYRLYPFSHPLECPAWARKLPPVPYSKCVPEGNHYILYG